MAPMVATGATRATLEVPSTEGGVVLAFTSAAVEQRRVNRVNRVATRARVRESGGRAMRERPTLNSELEVCLKALYVIKLCTL